MGPTLEFYDNIAEDFKNWKIEIGEPCSCVKKREDGIHEDDCKFLEYEMFR